MDLNWPRAKSTRGLKNNKIKVPLRESKLFERSNQPSESSLGLGPDDERGESEKCSINDDWELLLEDVR